MGRISKRNCLYDILVHCEGVDFKVTGVKFMNVYWAKRRGMLLARVTTTVPLCLSGNRTFYTPFRHTLIRQLLCLIVEAVKLAQAGFEDFLADTRVRKLKGQRDYNKEV